MAFGLFRKRPQPAEITVVPDRPAYLPGDTVIARVSVVSPADAEEAEVVVSLDHVEEIGQNPTVRDRWAVCGEYVLDGEPLRAGEARQWTVALPVPRRTTPPDDPADCADERYPASGDDAAEGSFDAEIEPEERWGPPTSEGRGLRTGWVVHAALRGGALRGGKAASGDADVPVVVLAPPGPAAPLAPRMRGEGPPACTVSFADLPAASVPPGTAVSGRIRLVAHRELDARAVRVDLVRVVRLHAGGDVVAWEELGSVQVAGAGTLRARSPREHRFVLEVPAGAPPSAHVGNGAAEYLLRAVVDLPLREDVVWDQPLAVHGTG